jgi:hypothetical protein
VRHTRSALLSLSLALAATACGGSKSDSSSSTVATAASASAAKSTPSTQAADTEAADTKAAETTVSDDDRDAMMKSITSAGVDEAIATCVVDRLAEELAPADFAKLATASIEADVPANIEEIAGAVSLECAQKAAGPTSEAALDTTAQSADTTVQPADTVPAQTVGTQSDPVTLGTAISMVNGYDLAINSYTPNADSAVKAAGEFNDVAPAGSQYVLLNVTVTNNGTEDKRVPAFDIAFKAVGVSGKSYEVYDCSAVVLEPAPIYDDLFKGKSATGNLCLIVDNADSEGLTVYVDAFDASFNQVTYYFNLA